MNRSDVYNFADIIFMQDLIHRSFVKFVYHRVIFYILVILLFNFVVQLPFLDFWHMSFKILARKYYRDVESVSFVREHFEIRLFSLVEISFFLVSAFVSLVLSCYSFPLSNISVPFSRNHDFFLSFFLSCSLAFSPWHGKSYYSFREIQLTKIRRKRILPLSSFVRSVSETKLTWFCVALKNNTTKWNYIAHFIYAVFVRRKKKMKVMADWSGTEGDFVNAKIMLYCFQNNVALCYDVCDRRWGF